MPIFRSIFRSMFNRRSSTNRHCSFCLEQGHTIRSCCHVDVDYLYHEFMYLHRRYGEYFMSVNLTVLFQPHEAQALLHYPAIREIRSCDHSTRRFLSQGTMVTDVMMTRAVSLIYRRLQIKLYSMNRLPRVYLSSMDVVGPIMEQTIQMYESSVGPITNGTIIAGYHNFITQNRHARFRSYDYEIYYQEAIMNSPEEDYPEYVPVPIIGSSDINRYGLARERVNHFAPLLIGTDSNSNRPVEEVVAPPAGEREEEEPEWLDTRPPRNVTVRSRTLRHFRYTEHPTYDSRRIADDLYQMMFEDWSVYSQQFDITYKLKPIEVEVEVVEKPSTGGTTNTKIECPICMSDVESSQTVFLGCCVYSFCSDCYSNQYLTKEQRKHTCMMCRTPFTKIQVFDTTIAEKLKHKRYSSLSSLDSSMTPSDLTEMEDDFRTLGGEVVRTSSFHFDDDVLPLDTPMTLSEIL